MDIKERIMLLENTMHSLGAFKECFLETHNFIEKIDSVIFTLNEIVNCEKNLLDRIENKKENSKDTNRGLEIKNGLVTRLL